MSKKENTVDYFPHPCTHGRKMFVVESQFGNDGYATWFKILEEIGSTHNHYLDLSDETVVLHIAAKCRISEEKLMEIIDLLIRLNALQKNSKNQLTSLKFLEGISPVYKKRGKLNLLQKVEHKFVSVTESEFLEQEGGHKSVSVPENRQSRVEYSRVEESKEKLKEKWVLEILEKMNEITGQKKQYNPKTQYFKTIKKNMLARKKEGFSDNDFLKVVQKKTKQWAGTEREIYLRPETLFCAKHFESYLNEPEPKEQTGALTNEINKFKDA